MIRDLEGLIVVLLRNISDEATSQPTTVRTAHA